MLPYGIIGNCRTCALVRKNAAVEWMCFPTFSSPSIFAKILDEKNGGSLEIKTKGKYKITQAYLPNTAIMETTFESKKNSFKVIDFFPRYRRLLTNKQERLYQQNRLIRIIKPLKGKPVIRLICDAKPHYARTSCTWKKRRHGGACKIKEGYFEVASNIDFTDIIKQKEIALEQTKFIIVGAENRQQDFTVKKCMLLYRATKQYWQKWVDTLILPERHREQIIRSAITLKLLTYSPTGAIIAAATTSIPEEISSERTWDYRYCWLRDSLLHVDALKKIGRNYEAKKLMRFLIELVLKHKRFQIMYGITGETQLEEKKLTHLAGFHDSQPVRIGNAAYKQQQNDIYGEFIDIIYLYFCYYQYERKMTRKQWKFLCYTVREIEKHWQEKDSGIWEFRGTKRHYVYSKFMCWVGVDRAIKIAQFFKQEKYAHRWTRLRDAIYHEIMQKGFNQKVNSFTMYYGGTALDASLLHMAYHEFLPPSDPRMICTVKAIYQKLRRGEYLVQRYRIEDDFGKSRSAFTICSFWLVEALYYVGEKEKARTIYEKLLKQSNHLGLFSEDIYIKTKKLLGNFPQAYTHLALINTSILLSEWSAKRKKIDWKQVSRKKWI